MTFDPTVASVGQLVVFVLPDGQTTRPALVLSPPEAAPASTCDLQLFTAGAGDADVVPERRATAGSASQGAGVELHALRFQVPHAPGANNQPGTWHYPGS
jgi:hypothetical protein